MRLIASTLTLFTLTQITLCSAAWAGDLMALKATKVYVGNGEVLEHAVILIEDGKIITIGEDLPIEAGIPVLELDEDQVVMPGMIDAYSRLGSSDNGPNGTNPQVMAAEGFYPNSNMKDFLEAGVVTVGYYPPGRGIPGQAAALRTSLRDGDAQVLKDSTYLKVMMRSSRSEKDRIRSIYEEIEKFQEKETKNREKYDKAKEKIDDEKDKNKQKEAKKKLGDYEPLQPDPKVKAFMAVQDKSLPALVSLEQAGTYLHFLDALGDKPMEFSLRIPIALESDFGYVKEKVGEKKLRVVMDPAISVNPGTMQQRNLPGEYVAAGAKLVLIPRSENRGSITDWRQDVAVLIRAGLDEQVALSALTLEPANLLGLGETHGSLEVGKAADLLVLSRDPFEVNSEVQAVMVDGEIVHGKVGL